MRKLSVDNFLPGGSQEALGRKLSTDNFLFFAVFHFYYLFVFSDPKKQVIFVSDPKKTIFQTNSNMFVFVVCNMAKRFVVKLYCFLSKCKVICCKLVMFVDAFVVKWSCLFWL